MHIVLEERVSVWDELVKRAKGGKPIGKCKECTKSQVKKDAERRVAEAEAMGHEDVVDESEIALQNGPEVLSVSDWCCMHRVLSLQDDFANEKPMLQEYIEKWGHVCIFLPKFHCELNLIEMLWGYAKYHKSSIFCFIHSLTIRLFITSGYCAVADGRFPTARLLVQQSLDMCEPITVCCFFRKMWWYLDAYRYVSVLPLSLLKLIYIWCCLGKVSTHSKRLLRSSCSSHTAMSGFRLISLPQCDAYMQLHAP